LSDGSPAFSSVSGDIFQFTRNVVRSIEKSNKLEIYGIGIQSDNVENIYTENAVIYNVEELDEALLTLVKHKILKGSKQNVNN